MSSDQVFEAALEESDTDFRGDWSLSVSLAHSPVAHPNEPQVL